MSEFWKWLDEAYADGSKGEEPKFTKYNMEVAYAAGRAASDKRVAELEAEIKRLTGFVVQRRKMCDDYDKALEEVANQMHGFKAELALSVGLLRRYHELLSTIAMHRATAPKDWGDHFKAEFDRRIAELSNFLARHGGQS
ncbi:Uncharacterised protein [Pseudomonas luteola]|uniref:Uncharacterized protein n=1 Tax=Pseudomonas luteola TaxID=47886 RepID=A0A2X2CJY4_PSELU|nr:hypothetical protein [Pseudomonas luteola]SPZ07624.1 Uncharacterised protein [Pseudomonas luteola]